MKKVLLITVLAFSASCFAQPVIQNGSNLPSPGYSAPLSAIVSSSTDITAGGANHTWNFGAYTFAAVGTVDIVAPSATPFGSSFPSANFAYTLAGTYSYFNAGATKMEVQAYTISAPGSGNDYTPNPRTLLKFPFSFNDIETDTYQKVNGSPDAVTLTYDAYGTLITPTGTYTNVVRIRENYGAGADDYQWYILNPLMQVAIFDHNSSTLYHIAATQIINGVETNSPQMSVDIFPNPATESINVHNIPGGSTITITDMTGKLIYSSFHTNTQETINASTYANGIYVVRITSDGKVISRKLVVNR